MLKTEFHRSDLILKAHYESLIYKIERQQKYSYDRCNQSPKKGI